MSAVRKPLLQSPSDRFPLLLVINREIEGKRRRNLLGLMTRLVLAVAVLGGVLNMFHGIAR